MKRAFRKAVTTAMLAALVGFAMCPAKVRWEGTIRIENGVTFVENAGEGLWGREGDPAIKLVKEIQIGEVEGEQPYLFAYLVDVTSDAEGNIYVVDVSSFVVRKFDKAGRFIMEVGRQGEGPGEFKRINNVFVNADNELLVFDPDAGRITVFDGAGDYVKTFSGFMEGHVYHPGGIFQTEDGGYLFFSKMKDSINLFHLFEAEWKKIQSFGPYAFIDKDQEAFETRQLGTKPGRGYLQPDGALLYTKHFYDHQIFLYEGATLKKVIKRKTEQGPPYEVEVMHDREKALDMRRRGEIDFRSFGPGASYMGRVYRETKGVFRLNNGHIAHFISERVSKETWVFGVELYDAEGRFLTFEPLDTEMPLTVRHKDATDLFYAIDYAAYPKIITFRLVYDEAY